MGNIVGVCHLLNSFISPAFWLFACYTQNSLWSLFFKSSFFVGQHRINWWLHVILCVCGKYEFMKINFNSFPPNWTKLLQRPHNANKHCTNMSTIEANTQQKGKNDEKKMEKEAIEEQQKKRKMASTMKIYGNMDAINHPSFFVSRLIFWQHQLSVTSVIHIFGVNIRCHLMQCIFAWTMCVLFCCFILFVSHDSFMLVGSQNICSSQPRFQLLRVIP